MNKLIHAGETTNRDLRRALAFYLIGFTALLFILVLMLGDFVGGLAADPTTADPEFTSQIIYYVLLFLAIPFTITSQLWYLRIKHIYRGSNNNAEVYKQILPEATIILWSVLTLVGFISFPESWETQNILIRAVLYLTPLSLFILLGVLIIYYPAIIIWNLKRTIDARYPEMNTSIKTASSVALGLVLAVAYAVLASFFLLISFHNLV